jgi:hypothetical protein
MKPSFVKQLAAAAALTLICSSTPVDARPTYQSTCASLLSATLFVWTNGWWADFVHDMFCPTPVTYDYLV